MKQIRSFFLSKEFWLLVLMGAWVVVIYSNSFSVPFQFDDLGYIVNNSSIRDIHNWSAIRHALREPTRVMAFFSFALNYHFHRLDVFGYHLVNVVIHAVNGCLVWWLVRLLLSSPKLQNQNISRDKMKISFCVALLFVTHPIQTQAVTYITQRIASLATLFYLGSICFYLQARLRKKYQAVLFFISGMAALLGMFTKEIVFTLPLAILLIEHLLLREEGGRKAVSWKVILPLALFLLIVPVAWLFDFPGFLLARYESGSHVGDVITSGNYLLTQFRVIVRYIQLLFFPTNQNLYYDFAVSRHFFEPATFLSFLFLSALFISAFLVRRRQPLVALSIFWFFLTLCVESSIVPIRHVIFEHRLYLPSVGFCLGLVVGAYQILKGRKFVMALLALAALFSFLTYERNKVWYSEISLWSDVAQKSSNKASAYNNLGVSYLRKSRCDVALPYFDKAIALKANYPEAYNNRGLCYQLMGKADEAVKNYSRAVELNPDYAGAYSNRGLLYREAGRNDLAKADYDKAISLVPDSPDLYNNRAFTFMARGEGDLALADFKKAMSLNPDFEEPYNNIGLLYQSQGQMDEAFNYFNKVLRINPSYDKAYNNRGLAYRSQGKVDLALADFNKAIGLKTGDVSRAKAYNNRGLLYRDQGKYDAALTDFNEAIRLTPNYALAYSNRGVVYDLLKRSDLALPDFNQSVQFNPSHPDVLFNRGLFYYRQGKYALAIEDFTAALKITPQHASAYLYRSQANANLGNKEKALQDILKAQGLGIKVEKDYIQKLKSL